MKRKPLVVAGFFLCLIVVVAFLVLTGIASAWFNLAFGNDVCAVVIEYSPSLGQFGTVDLALKLSAILIRVPIETVLAGFSQVCRVASFNDSFAISLVVLAIVANNIHVYDRTLSFQDAEPRVLTCYLKDYDWQLHPTLTIAVNGQYVLNGRQFNFGPYNGVWTF